MTAGRSSTSAPAKVNLFLRVLNRRDDGYRELETLFQTLTLADHVAVAVGADHVAAGRGADKTEALDVVGDVSVRVTGADVGPPGDNLVVRAARSFVERFRIDAPVHIDLTKRIPTGAGLGGGSSDAAAVLRCLGRLAGAGSPEELAEIGADLGSDVPFFLTPSGLALGRGRGERLTPLPPLTRRSIVLALPPVHVATGPAYARLGEARDDEDPHGGPRALAVQDFATWEGVDALVENDFEGTVAGDHDEVAHALRLLRRDLRGPVLLSGSGGACFGFAESPADADRTATALSTETGWDFVAVATRSTPPDVRLTP